jgi:hypothetical protein
MLTPAPRMLSFSDFYHRAFPGRRRGVMAATAVLLSIIGLSAAIPVLSRLELIGSGRGLALTLGADAPFILTASEKTADKTASILSVKCSNVIYGLDEYQFTEFPRGSPLKNIIARENKENGSIELSIKVLFPLDKNIRIKQKDNRWVVLLTSAPVNDFAWSAQNETRNPAGKTQVDEQIMAKNAAPSPSRSSPPKSTASSFLEDITILHRERVEKIVFKFDTSTEMIVKSMPDKIMVLFVNSKNSLSHTTFKSEKDWLVKSIELKEVVHGGTVWLGASIFVNRDGGEKPLVQTFADRLVIYSVRDTQQCLYLWSARNGTTLSYNFISPPEYRVDLKKMESRVLSDSKNDMGKTGTFSVREPASPAQQAAQVTPPTPRTIRVVIKKDNVALRSHPSATPSSAIVGHMPFGAIATQLEKKGPWIRIEMDTVSGWIAGALAIDSAQAPKALWIKIESEKIAEAKREEQFKEAERIRLEKKARQEQLVLAKQKAVEAQRERVQEAAKTAAAKQEEQLREADKQRQEKKVQQELAATKQIEHSKEKPLGQPSVQPSGKPMPMENIVSTSTSLSDGAQPVSIDKAKATPQPQQPSDTVTTKKQVHKLVEYRVYGRDPFLPIKQDEEGPLPNVEKLKIVGILYDHSSRIALLEDMTNPGNAFALRENDPVKNGYLVKIQSDKVVFLLNEFGISRTYSMKLNKDKPETQNRQQTGDY